MLHSVISTVALFVHTLHAFGSCCNPRGEVKYLRTSHRNQLLSWREKKGVAIYSGPAHTRCGWRTLNHGNALDKSGYTGAFHPLHQLIVGNTCFAFCENLASCEPKRPLVLVYKKTRANVSQRRLEQKVRLFSTSKFCARPRSARVLLSACAARTNSDLLRVSHE